MRKACSVTIDKDSKMTLDDMYACMHSPMRTQMYWLEWEDIPTFVSVHFVRHTIAWQPFVRSNREDRASHTGDKGRWESVNTSVLCNAESLINVAAKRLCYQASKETRELMEMTREAVRPIDFDLYYRMVPMCIKDRVCREKKSCGVLKKFLTQNEDLCSIEKMLDRSSWYGKWNETNF